MVVLYLHSTSNHNTPSARIPAQMVVLYLHSTSNHNWSSTFITIPLLYYIFILHQTTTVGVLLSLYIGLYYIFILHQTTTSSATIAATLSLYYIFILHQTTTFMYASESSSKLYYIFILHQTTTCAFLQHPCSCCIISSFYIKPQLCLVPQLCSFVVLYLHSTSNHNIERSECFFE